jgi:ATP:ADP antiporter, AAA family
MSPNSKIPGFECSPTAGTRIGVVYYIWVGIFNVFTVAQLWAFATDIFSQEQGERLFPLLGVGASAGAVAGAWGAGRLLKPLGTYKIMLIAVAALCICAALTQLAGSIITKRGGELEKRKDQATLSSEGGFQLLMRDRYLMLIAILAVLLNIVGLFGDFIFGKLLVDQTNHVVGTAASLMKARKAYIGSYYASYYEWTNAASFIIQTFLVSRIFKRFGVRGSMFVLPVISLGTFVMILADPVLQVVRVLKIVENSTNYSHQNTVRAALLLPTSREAKYKAKAAIETFCVRLGDVLQAGLIFIGTSLHFGVQAFAGMTLAITLLWLFVTFKLDQEHKRKVPEFH